MRPVDEPFPGLAGGRVVVTGGTRGIGAGIARGFLRAGAQVLVCSRQEPASPPSADGRTAVFARAASGSGAGTAGDREAADLFAVWTW
jgi:NAD(P)-dependent dehydrogenase (short-subunit alcohol dehydrogenase family)